MAHTVFPKKALFVFIFLVNTFETFGPQDTRRNMNEPHRVEGWTFCNCSRSWLPNLVARLPRYVYTRISTFVSNAYRNQLFDSHDINERMLAD